MKLLNQIWQMPRTLVSAVTFVVIAFLGTHASSLWAGSGVVLDEATKKPLAGVFVYAMWYAEVWNPVIARSDRCIAHAITQTDENGKFKLRDFSWNFEFWMTGRTRVVDYYVAGYDLVDENASDPPIVYMRQFTGTVAARLTRIMNVGGQNCLAVNERKVLLPLYKARYEEAKSVAVTPEEKKIASNFKDVFDEIDLGEKEFMRRRSVKVIK
jgi:hypothetical protein